MGKDDRDSGININISRRLMLGGMACAATAPLLGNVARAATSTGDELTWLPATRLRDMIAKKEVSALEVTNHFLARIERLNPLLHAFVHVDPDGARRAAREADKAVANGKPLGPLHGVPMGIKDQIWAKGLPSTCGSQVFANFRPSFDGTIVERLRAAGAIIVGTTNMPEFAAWPRSKSYVAGEAVNPWDTSRIPGASSGGSGAAVAAGMVPVAIGTDGGGSTRIPASLCGLVGVLPTFGRVPGYGGFHCGLRGSAGPMARSVRDAAVVLQIISGPDPRMSRAIQTPAPDGLTGLETGVRGMRVAWSPDFGRLKPDPAVLASAQLAAHALAGAGADVTMSTALISHPWGNGDLLADLQRAVGQGGFEMEPVGDVPDTSMMEKWLIESSVTGIPCFELPPIKKFLAEHSGLLSPPQRLMSKFPPNLNGLPSDKELHGQLDPIFAKHDVICSPTMLTVAPSVPPGWAIPYDNMYMGTDFTFIANTMGYPAVTVPCGLVRGLPVGLQILGQWGSEATVLRVARAVEAALPQMGSPPIA